jgi:hypothetical protein
MELSIVTRIKNAKDAKMLLSINKRFGRAKILKAKYLEDFYLAQELNKGMKSANVLLDQVHRELRKIRKSY